MTGQQQTRKWTVEEKQMIAAVAYPLIELQKAFGRVMDAKLVMQGWEMKLAGRFTVEEILYALDQYTDKRDDFPTPANLIAIMRPAPPEITQAEYIAAQDWLKRNNYPSTYEASEKRQLIKDFERQSEEKRESHVIECDKIRQIALGAGNRMQQIENQGAQ